MLHMINHPFWSILGILPRKKGALWTCRPGSLQVREIDAFGRCTIPMWNVRDRCGRRFLASPGTKRASDWGKSCGSGGFFMGKGSVIFAVLMGKSAIIGWSSSHVWLPEGDFSDTRTRNKREFHELNLVFGLDTPEIVVVSNKEKFETPRPPKKRRPLSLENSFTEWIVGLLSLGFQTTYANNMYIYIYLWYVSVYIYNTYYVKYNYVLVIT